MPSTTRQLVIDLRRKPATAITRAIIFNALQGWYHCESQHYDYPKQTLIAHLLKAGFNDLAEKTAQGEYNECDQNPPDRTQALKRLRQTAKQLKSKIKKK